MTRWKFLKIALLCLAIAATIFTIYMLFFQSEDLITTISFSEFSDRLESNDIKSVVIDIDGNSIVGEFKDGSSFKVIYKKKFTISLDDKLITEKEKLKFSDVAISDPF